MKFNQWFKEVKRLMAQHGRIPAGDRKIYVETFHHAITPREVVEALLRKENQGKKIPAWEKTSPFAAKEST